MDDALVYDARKIARAEDVLGAIAWMQSKGITVRKLCESTAYEQVRFTAYERVRHERGRRKYEPKLTTEVDAAIECLSLVYAWLFRYALIDQNEVEIKRMLDIYYRLFNPDYVEPNRHKCAKCGAPMISARESAIEHIQRHPNDLVISIPGLWSCPKCGHELKEDDAGIQKGEE